MKRGIIYVVIILLAGGCAGWLLRGGCVEPTAEVGELPEAAAPVTVISHEEMAQIVPRSIELTDEGPVPPPRAVEHIEATTEAGAVPKETVDALLDALARAQQETAELKRAMPKGGATVPDVGIPDPRIALKGRTRFELTKYEGQLHGKLTAGWTGQVFTDICINCPDEPADSDWQPFHVAPLDPRLTTAVSVRPPGTVQERLASYRWEVRLGVGAPITDNERGDFEFDVGISKYGKGRLGWYVSTHVDPDPMRLTWFSAGLALSIGRS